MEDIRAGNHVRGLAKIGNAAKWLVTVDAESIFALVDSMWHSGVKLENFYLNNTNQSS
ncbi:MAG: hypothetical protein NKF70_00985 [Methanobacterium sp. ERen5]|nr:MAG: hypothetical protein NKF70_00985 [Methanobacterium sp. ERen5]